MRADKALVANVEQAAAAVDAYADQRMGNYYFR